ncbi:MAG: acyltransferase family protein, partial [Aquihabitans sp.]
MPALDGLRAVAVAAVVAFHLGRLGGGFIGVDVFFVISGFLITRLLLAERERSGRVALGAFWGRRFRRLLPA